MPAPVSQTAMNIEQSCASLMLDDVLRTFRYCRISGTDMRRRARRKRSPADKQHCQETGGYSGKGLF